MSEPVTWYRVKKSMTLRRWTSGSMVRTVLSIISAISLSYIENSGQQVILFQELLESANVHNVPMSLAMTTMRLSRLASRRDCGLADAELKH